MDVFKLKTNKNKRIEKSIHESIRNILSLKKINEIAKETKFIQRDCKKINAKIFLALNVFYEKNICVESLANLCNCLSDNDYISISSQSLDERFNSKAVNFLKCIFKELLTFKMKQSLNYKQKFNRIIITDSTSFQLPDKFEELFKGYNGSATKSSVKIQLTNDLITGNILAIDIFDAKNSDGKYLDIIEQSVEAKDLLIKDLGYYSLKHFKKIEKLNSYYVSRLKLSTAVYTKNLFPKKFKTTGNIEKETEYIRVDLLEESRKLKENQIKELTVYIGGEGYSKLQTRLIIYKMSDELAKKKRVHQKFIEHKKGITTSEKLIELNNVNMFITNIEESVIPKELVYLLYSLRWQIELIFKAWKSIYGIHKINPVKNERFLCHLYGTLISLLLSTKLVFLIRNKLKNEEVKEISEYKTFKTIHEFLRSLGQSILKDFFHLEQLLGKILEMTLKNGLKSIKNKKETSLGILEMINLSSPLIKIA